MRYFCTYFDINYLPKAMCMLDSLEKYCPAFTMYVLCLDEGCFHQIESMNHVSVVPIKLIELEERFSYLGEVKQSRSQIEYYYTCGPVFLKYVIEINPEIDILTYLDADLYFFHSLEPLYEAFEGYSIGVVGHHMPEFRTSNRRSNKFGLYNVGWISFRRDKNGLSCLEWWRDRCVEWCYDRYEDGKFADQLYLNQWPELFDGFYEFVHHGANVAAWNVADYKFSYRDGMVYVDDDPLIFYHFHGFKRVSNRIYNTNLGLSFKKPDPVLRKNVFLKYIKCLIFNSRGLDPTAGIRSYKTSYYLFKVVVRFVLGIVFGQYIYVSNAVYESTERDWLFRQ